MENLLNTNFCFFRLPRGALAFCIFCFTLQTSINRKIWDTNFLHRSSSPRVRFFAHFFLRCRHRWTGKCETTISSIDPQVRTSSFLLNDFEDLWKIFSTLNVDFYDYLGAVACPDGQNRSIWGEQWGLPNFTATIEDPEILKSQVEFEVVR